jgi:hypothetical protein
MVIPMADDKDGTTNNAGMGVIFAVLLLIITACGSLFFVADYWESRPVKVAAHTPGMIVQGWAR